MNRHLWILHVLLGMFVVSASVFAQSPDAVARRAFGGIQPILSPDGKAIALSFQGSIARMPAEGGVLTRLTREAGWDIEPAWSPDSKRIAYIQSAAMTVGQVKIIAADDGTSVTPPKAVIAHGRLQFHPDGQRLLGMFTTTGQPDRLQWLQLATGELTRANIIMPLEPLQRTRMKWALSPDGAWILFTKNFDVLGEQTGNNGPATELWRVPSAGGEATAVTRWPARILSLCWGRDGQGVFIVTDRGGALYDVWYLPLANPLAGGHRVTFGQTDEDWPSVSADGRWLLHSENSERATALTRVALVSGRRESLSLDRVDFREPTGRLHLEILDAQTGEPLAARVSVLKSEGKYFFPLGALYRCLSGRGQFYVRQSARLDLPAGRYTIRVSRGFEYFDHEEEVEVAADQTRESKLALDRWIDMPARGWFSGENHIHANYGAGAWHHDPSTVRDQCEGEDLHVGNIVVANADGNGVFDREFFLGQPDPLSTRRTILYWNQEFRSTIWGHLTLGNLSQIVEPIFTGFRDTTNPYDVPTNGEIADRTRAQGGTVSYTHPAPGGEDLYAAAYSAKGLPVDAALGKVDIMDVMGPGYLGSRDLWYWMLNCGFRIPASAGTDVFLNRIVSNPPGWGRAYVRLTNGLTYSSWMNGQRVGQSFITSGPMLEMTAAGLLPGDTLRLDSPGSVRINARAWSQHQLDGLEVIVNGRVLQSVKPGANPRELILEDSVPINQSGWLAVRCSAQGTNLFAHMNPVYIEVRDRPCDARTDAEALLKWIDRLEADLRRRDRLPGSSFDQVKSQFDTARGVYRKLTR